MSKLQEPYEAREKLRRKLERKGLSKNAIKSQLRPCLTWNEEELGRRDIANSKLLSMSREESMELPVLSAEDILTEELAGAGLSAGNPVAAGPDAAAMQVQEVQLRKLDKQSQIIEDPDPVKAVTALAQRLFSEGIL